MRAFAAPLALLALIVCGAGAPVAAEDAALQAGFASVDLTPKLPVPMGGYGSLTPRMAKSVHDPIQAHACVLKQGKTGVALVSVDFVGVSQRLSADVAFGTRWLDMPVIVTATHTHASFGGLTDAPLWRPMMGPFDEALYEATRDKIVNCVLAAVNDLKPASLSYIRGEVSSLSRNRRVADGPIDPRLRVLRVDGSDGAVRGLLVGWTAHPTFSSSKNTALSAGWPGAMRKTLRTRWPKATVLFFNGAMGDVSPRLPPAEDDRAGHDRARAYGEAIASRVWAFAEGARPIQPQLRVSEAAAPAPSVANRLLGVDDAAALGTDFGPRLPVARIRLAAGLTLVTAPGEPTVAAGQTIEKALPDDDVWLVSCAIDHLGYFADRALFRGGGYEAQMSFFGPGAADALARAARGDAPSRPQTKPTDRSVPVVLSGRDAYRLGLDHGRKLAWEIHDLLTHAVPTLIAHAKKAGVDEATRSLSLLAGGVVDPDDLIIPLLVRAARTLQPHIPPEYLDEMEGVADGAGVAYDAILLLNTFLTLAEQTNPRALITLPVRCTNVVAFGDATCMGQMLHASTLDWGMGDVLRSRARVMVFEPAQGHPFVSIGWPGMVGTLRAMNAAGLSITEESCAAPRDTRLEGVPLPILLRRAIQHTGDWKNASIRVAVGPGTCGYKVTIADGNRMDACTVAVTARKAQVRKPKDGLLYGVEPDAEPERFLVRVNPDIPRSDASSRERYAALRKLIEPGRQCLRRSLLSWALSQREGRLFNENTLLACVFEPGMLRFHVALGEDVPAHDPEGTLSWKTFSLPALLTPGRWQRHDPLQRALDFKPTWKDMKPLLGLRRAEILFDSPRPSGRDFNDRVRAEAWLPKGAPKGVVIHLPAWKEPTLAGHRFLAANLVRKGIATVILPMPYQHGRTAKGERPGQRTLSPNLAQTRQAIVQALAEVRALAGHLRAKYGTRVAISGVSLGGHVAAVAYGAFPKLFDGGAFVLAGGNVIEAFLLPNSVTGKIQQELARRGVTLAEARELVKDFEPLHFADPKRGARVVIIAADEDDVVPPDRARALAKAYGDAKIVWLDGGHYAPVRPDQAARLIKAVGEHLTNVFEAE